MRCAASLAAIVALTLAWPAQARTIDKSVFEIVTETATYVGMKILFGHDLDRAGGNNKSIGGGSVPPVLAPDDAVRKGSSKPMTKGFAEGARGCARSIQGRSGMPANC